MEDDFQQGSADPCLYNKKVRNQWIFLLIYVDNILVISKQLNLIKHTEDIMNKKFEIKNLGAVQNYLGLEIDQDSFGNYRINQSTYISKI